MPASCPSWHLIRVSRLGPRPIDVGDGSRHTVAVEITFLGSGGAFVDHRINYHNNAVIQTNAGPVLLDCGTTAMQSLRELEMSPWALQAVLFTHVHADHASPQELIGIRYYSGPAGGRGRLRTPLYAPADVIEPLGASLAPYLDEYEDDRGLFSYGGLDGLTDRHSVEAVEIGGVCFTWFRVPHVRGDGVDKPAYGIRIDDGERVVIWSGDTTLNCDWLGSVLDDMRVVRVFHDCTFGGAAAGRVHANFEALSALPADWTRRITLMHHGVVPEGVSLEAFAGAASRHQTFIFGDSA